MDNCSGIMGIDKKYVAAFADGKPRQARRLQVSGCCQTFVDAVVTDEFLAIGFDSESVVGPK